MNYWQAAVIKGNQGEIGALACSEEVLSRGVDSVGVGFSDPVRIVKELSLRERCIVAMTGVKDYISDGRVTIELSNGHYLLGLFSGSGCMLGAIVAAFCGAANMNWRESGEQGVAKSNLSPGDMLTATVGGVLALTIASEIAAEKCGGPGTYLPSLIDALFHLKPEDIVNKAKLKVFTS